jgi:hypothetical protein
MAVCANDIAPLDLIQDRLPFVAADALGDAEALVSDVVELEQEGVRLTAVNARTLAEVLDEVGHALSDQCVLSTRGIRDVALAVGRIVLLFVCSSTRAAIVVALALSLAVPGELIYGL